MRYTCLPSRLHFSTRVPRVATLAGRLGVFLSCCFGVAKASTGERRDVATRGAQAAC